MSEQANPLGLMSIGSVAAHNIAAFLNLDEKHVPAIEQAIKDEISAMSTHFTLAIADVQTQYEIALSGFNYVKSNKLAVALTVLTSLVTGGIITHFIDGALVVLGSR